MNQFSIAILLFSVFTLNAHEVADHKAAEKKAIKAIGKLGMNLKKELRSAMQKSTEHALSKCSLKAMPLTEEISKQGIEVGRVSLKNRNPKNKPQDWMLKTIEAYHQKKITDPYTVVQIDNEKHGILRPITTMPVCLKCHGSNIDEKLKFKLNILYPADKATGYKNGEIRGFFYATY
jgi:hypothetical protein